MGFKSGPNRTRGARSFFCDAFSFKRPTGLAERAFLLQLCFLPRDFFGRARTPASAC
jgi:hypothetical protein